MATAPTSAEAKPAKRGGKMKLVIIAVVVVAAIAGGAFWLTHRPKSAHAAEAAPAADAAPTEVKSVLHLEGFVVNLAGEGANGYLRIGVDLGLGVELKEGQLEKGPMPTARLRDAILSVLSTRSVAELLTAEGKTKLKADMLASINEKVPEVACQEIYFTEFLVQQ